ncbi:MAG: hypothetical protein ACTHN5_13520 [Phycisphaerae bacterium]
MKTTRLRTGTSSAAILTTLFSIIGAACLPTAAAGNPIDPHPYPKPALLSDVVTAADYATIILSPPLQAALKVTDHQRAVFDAMRKRFDAKFNNVMGMDINPALNVARMKRVLDLTGNQIRDQLTVDQDKQVQDYFAKKVLSPVTVESQDSDTPVYNPHLVYIPGFGPQYVQGTLLHSGSITVHYTKFSDANAAIAPKTGDAQPAAPIASETVDPSDLPPLDPDAQKHRDELRQRTREHAAHFRAQSQSPGSQNPPAAPQVATATPVAPAAPEHAPAISPMPRARSAILRPLQTSPLRVPPIQPLNASPTPSTDKLADSFLQSLATAFSTNSFVTTHAVGGGFADQTAFDLPARPGVLIGFELGTGDFMRTKTIQSITPIYLTAAGEVRGHSYGRTGLPTITLKAKNGYAVGGITARGGGGFDGLSLIYMKRTPTALDPNDHYASQAVGADLAERAEDLSGNGTPVTGVFVKVGDRGFLGLGLVFANSPKE